MQFNPSNWYWRRASDGAVYSSAARRLVAVDDTSYAAWMAGGNHATPWPIGSDAQPSNAALDEVLTSLGLPVSGLVTASLSDLAAQAKAAVSAAAGAVVAGVTPDAAHQAAFQNAAAILNGNGGAAPSSGPLATAFGALASAYALSSSAFATVVLDVQAASLTLAAAVATFNSAATVAGNADALASALSAFETALGGVVTSINAVLPVPVTAPPAIRIAGINA